MISQYRLTQGPSREQLFDALRLGGSTPSLSIIEFWGTARPPSGGETGSLLAVQIEGLQRFPEQDDREWWFWGNLRQHTSGPHKPYWESKIIGHMCGGWNTYQRKGFIRIASEPFWISPFGDGPLNAVISRVFDTEVEPPSA